ncbi:uncharacterized protein LOC141853605 [Brevipalpus obovatus]|uniref:uncharacterized protein LOC141853605 n=1 Tax=Brevipalpus obovatus TaxID=246614 RepID=UPI003D9DECE0
MDHEKDVIRFGKKLDEMVTRKEFTQAMDILKALKDTPVTLELLQKTRIGLAVNNIRKNCGEEEVRTQAKSLVRWWKKLLEPGKDGMDGKNGKNCKDGKNFMDGNVKKDGKSETVLSDDGKANDQPKKVAPSSDKAPGVIKNSGDNNNTNCSSKNVTQSKNQSQEAKNNGIVLRKRKAKADPLRFVQPVKILTPVPIRIGLSRNKAPRRSLHQLPSNASA